MTKLHDLLCRLGLHDWRHDFRAEGSLTARIKVFSRNCRRCGHYREVIRIRLLS